MYVCMYVCNVNVYKRKYKHKNNQIIQTIIEILSIDSEDDDLILKVFFNVINLMT